MVRLKDIADLTGVSISTVSRALKGSDRISDATKRLVQEAANELMFRKGIVSQAAKPISRRVGLMFPSHGEYYHNDPTSSADLRGLQTIFELSGHSVVMIPFNYDSDGSLHQLKTVIQREGVEGIVLSDPPFLSHIPQYLDSLQLPFIIVNGIYRDAPFKQIDFDNYSGMNSLVKHLIEKGYRDYAVLTGPKNRSVNKNRMDGLQEAFESAGISPLCIIPGEFSMESGYERGISVLEEYPSTKTLICFSDYIALGAMKAIREAGKTIPNDVKVTGFDDVSFSKFSDPPLTTVKRHSEDFSPLVMNSLINFIEKGADVAQATILFKTSVIERDSA